MKYCTKLSNEELKNRLSRLAKLICIFEEHTDEKGSSICQKAVRAYNKTDNFTGIIKLTSLEKEFISYKLEEQFIDKEKIELIRFYCKIDDEWWEEIMQFNKRLQKIWEEK